MNYHQEPLKKSTFLDKIFRKIRQAGGIFPEISVLETAEIVALSYYSALGAEAKTINSKVGRFKRAFRKFLMRVTTDAVWIAYHRLLRY